MAELSPNKLKLCCSVNTYAKCRKCEFRICLPCAETETRIQWTESRNHRIVICCGCNKPGDWFSDFNREGLDY